VLKKIIVHGTICLDKVMRVDRLPERGGYVEVSGESWVLGGEAANTAANLVKWHAPIRLMVNPLGDDDAAERLKTMARSLHLPTEDIDHDGHTPVCEIFVTPDGERTMYGHGFAALAEGPFTAFDCSGAGWFTTDSNLGALAVRSLAHALANGLYTVAMDFAHRPDPPPASLHLTSLDWFKDDPPSWVVRTGQALLLTAGGAGSVLHEPGEPPRHFPAFPAPAVVDSTGAGDTFRAGILYGLQRGWTLARAAEFGAGASALAVGSLGASNALPRVDEVQSLIARYPEVSAAYDQA